MRKSTGRTSSNDRTSAKNPRSSSNGRSAAKSTVSNRNGGRSTSSPARRTGTTGSNPRSASEDLEKVMTTTLKDIYYAEKQLVKALGRMSKAAEDAELRQAFDTHKLETQDHVSRLEQAFEILGIRASGKNCPAMDGLIEEGAEAIQEFEKGPARDAALIVSAQKVEHYEIATYGSLRTFAGTLGYPECEQIFDEILEQESNTDETLTQIAMSSVNNIAAHQGEEGRMKEEMEEV